MQDLKKEFINNNVDEKNQLNETSKKMLFENSNNQMLFDHSNEHSEDYGPDSDP